MRHYPTDSPEAMGRIVALALMADGIVDRSETQLLEHQGIIDHIGLAHEQFDQIFYSFSEDMLASADRLASGQLELDASSVKRLLDEIRDPSLQKKIFHIMLDIFNADRHLTAGEALLIQQAVSQWDIDMHEVSYAAMPHNQCPSTA